MRITAILTLFISACIPVWAEGDPSKCADIKPAVKAMTVSFPQPVRKGKVWMSGEAGTAFRTTCDTKGSITEETQYQQKSILTKNIFSHKTRTEAKIFCANLRSEEKITSTFSEEALSALDDFCRDNSKKDYDMVLVYDGSVAEPKMTKQIFRLLNPQGSPVDEYHFDTMASLESRKTLKYNKNSELLETAEYDPQEALLSRETFSYDRTTNSKKFSRYNENNQLSRTILYEYRETGTLRRETRTSYDAAEQPLSRSEIYCDQKGDPEKELIYQGDMKTPVYEYLFSRTLDKKGNWTEERKTKLLIYNNKPLEDKSTPPLITKREISYY